MIDEIGKITLFVNNQIEAKRFWIEKMNFCVTSEVLIGPEMTLIEIKPNEQNLTSFVIYEKRWMKKLDPVANLGHPILSLSTSNIEKTYDLMKQREIEIGEIVNMPFGKVFFFKDQDGNDYTIRQK